MKNQVKNQFFLWWTCQSVVKPSYAKRPRRSQKAKARPWCQGGSNPVCCCILLLTIYDFYCLVHLWRVNAVTPFWDEHDDSRRDMWLPIKGLKGSFIGGIPNANPLAGQFFCWWGFAVPECHRQAHKAGPGKQHGSHSSTMDHPLVWVMEGQATPTSQPSSVKLSKNEYPWLISHFNTHLSTHTSMLLMKLLFVHSWEVQDLRNLFSTTSIWVNSKIQRVSWWLQGLVSIHLAACP